ASNSPTGQANTQKFPIVMKSIAVETSAARNNYNIIINQSSFMSRRKVNFYLFSILLYHNLPKKSIGFFTKIQR
ncbi:MAG: hypothetical protein K2H89_05550, partial [Oscillospiraceae bacterium]|nr:hypothetical protein [Oscillospiraceae bacterium]